MTENSKKFVEAENWENKMLDENVYSPAELDTRAFLKARAETMKRQTAELQRMHASRLRFLKQYYGVDLVNEIFDGPEPVKVQKVECCFCGETIVKNSLSICLGCHDELSAVVDQQPTDGELVDMQELHGSQPAQDDEWNQGHEKFDGTGRS